MRKRPSGRPRAEMGLESLITLSTHYRPSHRTTVTVTRLRLLTSLLRSRHEHHRRIERIAAEATAVDGEPTGQGGVDLQSDDQLPECGCPLERVARHRHPQQRAVGAGLA